jgi:hypothetical protein
MVDAIPTAIPEITRPTINIAESCATAKGIPGKMKANAYESGTLQSRPDNEYDTRKNDGFLPADPIRHITDQQRTSKRASGHGGDYGALYIRIGLHSRK